MIDLKVKYHNDLLPRLEKIDQGDWIDLRCAQKTEMKAGEFKLIPLGISVEIPTGYEMHIVPRGSTYKNYGVIQTNHMGIVDESYNGDDDIIMFPALAMRDTVIDFGDRICQFRLMKQQEPINFIEVASLGNDNRGGFGSTGKN